MVTTDLLNSMAKSGQSFLDITSAFDEGTVRFNVERADDLRWPLAFVFPKEGTFWNDHPFCILDQSGWTKPEQAEAAKMFLDHLLSAQVQATVPAFAIPSPAVSEAIIDQFLVTKRKTTISLAPDVSCSMQGEATKSTTDATAEFLDRLDPKDRLGLVVFNGVVTELTPVWLVSEVGETLRSQVLGLVADGGTNLHGAVFQAAKTMAAEQARDRTAGENRLYGMVLLSDGQDTAGAVSAGQMFETCLAVSGEQQGPRMQCRQPERRPSGGGCARQGLRRH